jgi:hypothetical protein
MPLYTWLSRNHNPRLIMRKTSDTPKLRVILQIPDQYFPKLPRTSKTRQVETLSHTSEDEGTTMIRM